MERKMFMRVAEVLDVSVPYAYKLIRKLNKELKDRGCMIIAGRIDRKYFYERFYGGTIFQEKEGKDNAGI